MKTYKVKLKDKENNTVLTHNLLAKDNDDAKDKCDVLVKEARNKQVVLLNFCLSSLV
ncbi:MAG: hypothetical protein IPJ01_11570 [Micavibrio sp.]|nr:hypothetical protein [Micavibrio sp.]